MKQILLRAITTTTARMRRLPRRFAWAAVGGLTLAIIIVAMLKTAAPIHASYQSTSHAINKPLVLQLDQYIRAIDLAKITTTPHVAGTWELRRGNALHPDQLIFTPATYFVVNTTYEINFPPVDRYIMGDRRLPSARVTTEAAPSLLPTGIAALKDSDTIAADYTFSAEFSAPNNHLRQLELRSEPTLEFDASIERDMIYRWKPRSTLSSDATVRVELFDTKNAKSLLTRTLKVAPAPALTSPVTRGQLNRHDTFSLAFSQPIEAGSERYIVFDTPGEGSWTSPTEYVYRPRELQPGHTYSYKISPGLRSTAGGIMMTEQTGSFSTIGAVRVIAAAPRGAELAQSRQVISFTFDQPVDHASAQRRFSVSGGTIQGFTWQGNTLQAIVTNLGFQRSITARVEAGVANAEFGLPSSDFYTHTFTTEVRSVRLAVPSYRQQHSGTCSAATLRMALAYRGITSDEMGLVNAMGYAPRNRDSSTNPPSWDDPNQMFVGSIDGSIIAGTGAGPDAAPIAKAARAYGRNAQNFTDADPNWIAEQLYAGNPVLMFGSFRATGMTSWRTPSGRMATMNLTGHVTVVIGVKGEPSNPLGFWVNDPLVGYTQYWSTGTIAANIARDPYRQAVVVY